MKFFSIVFCIVALAFVGCPSGTAADDIIRYNYIPDTSAPDDTVKICFIHHSTGSAWIATGNGNLGSQLNDNNYYVVETDYGWDYSTNDDIGSSTDTTDWPNWFNDTVMPSVYANDSHYDYTNEASITNPGDVDIVMFKSCYPCSEVGDSISDEQAIYNDLLDYFADHTDKMFILVIPPPEITIDSASLTRELSRWLVDRESGWLSGYADDNVYAFNYYNILTDPNNHHWVDSTGRETNIVSGSPVDSVNPDELYYFTGSNNHPTSDGHQKATEEFLPLLNGWYHLWKD